MFVMKWVLPDKNKYTHTGCAVYPCTDKGNLLWHLWTPLNDILSALVGLNKWYTQAKKNTIYYKSYCLRTYQHYSITFIPFKSEENVSLGILFMPVEQNTYVQPHQE